MQNPLKKLNSILSILKKASSWKSFFILFSAIQKAISHCHCEERQRRGNPVRGRKLPLYTLHSQ